MLKSLQDLSDYRATTANFRPWSRCHTTPATCRRSSKATTRSSAVGSVDASVDFSQLASTAIQTSTDGKSVTVTLPAPTYAGPHLDLDNSQILSRERGLLNRVGGMFTSDPTDDQSLYQLGDQALSDATAKTGLIDRTKTNTTGMLTGMLHGLGYQNVTVKFVEPAAP